MGQSCEKMGAGLTLLKSIRPLLRRTWKRITGRRFEKRLPDCCRGRIFYHCSEIARYHRMTSDTFERQAYRDSAIHSIAHHARELLKEM
jgi:hypothetical protein